MKVLRNFFSLFTLAVVGCSSAAPITGRVEEQLLPSQVVHDTYLIQVRLPPDYDSHPTRRYPAVYQLDGTNFGSEFAITAGEASDLEVAGRIADTLVIGIGYPYTDPLISTTMGRGRDYVTSFGDGRTGGADRRQCDRSRALWLNS
jgi:predicted alpha/beta superfamily hydrolase